MKHVDDQMEPANSLRLSDEFALAARDEFERRRSEIVGLLLEANVRHVGGTSIPGALTKGDLDIQVRVRLDSVTEAVAQLREIYATANDDMWNARFAAFEAPPGSLPHSTKISVVAIGSVYDRNGAFVWDLIAADPALLKQYNDLKREHAGNEAAYEDAKATFFGEVASRLADAPPY